MTSTSAIKSPVFDRPRFVGATQTALPIKHPSELPITTDTRVVLTYMGKDVLVRVTRVVNASVFEGEVLSLDDGFKPLGELALGENVKFQLADVKWIDRPPFERLIESGASKEQARAFLELLDEAKAGQLDSSRARERLISVGHPQTQAEALVQTLLDVTLQSSRLR